MKIACVDKTSAHRLLIQEYLESALEKNRSLAGFLPSLDIHSVSKNELLLTSSFDSIIIGSGFELEEVFSLVRELRADGRKLNLLLLLKEEDYHLLNLQKFKNYFWEIFSEKEPADRLVHSIYRIVQSIYSEKRGTLVTINSVKGGIGASSLVSGFAHSAHALGRTSLIIDFSEFASLLLFLKAPKSNFENFAEFIKEENFEQIEEFITESPSGIKLLTTSYNFREKWLRDAELLESSLKLLDALLLKYQLVIVDIAMSEGILPYAINSRANIRFVVSSNEPASLFLLNKKVKKISEIPGSGKTEIIFNCLKEKGLREKDISNFFEEDYQKQFIYFDRQASHWMGTGNSFYTQASLATQNSFDLSLKNILGIETLNKVSSFQRFFSQKKAISWRNSSAKLLSDNSFNYKNKSNKNGAELENIPRESTLNDFNFRGEITEEIGSLTLETLILFVAGISLATFCLPEFLSYVSRYFLGFSE